MLKLSKLINYIFLINIFATNGDLLIRKYRILDIPLLKISINNTVNTNKELHLHTNPFNIFIFLLKGSFVKEYFIYSKRYWFDIYKQYDYYLSNRYEAQRIHLKSASIWTLEIAYGKVSDWGYMLNSNTYVDHNTYNALKDDGSIPNL